MTAVIGLPAALVIGLVFGFGLRQCLLAGLVWYAALALALRRGVPGQER